MDDPARRQGEAVSDHGFAGRAPANLFAGLKELRPGGLMNSAVDAATAAQFLIGRIDDGIDLLFGDVAFNN